MRLHFLLASLVLCVLLAVPAAAQQEAVHWHHDLESAKTIAKETRRLVLVHFWTTTCGPCMALDQNVFNQPGVASAIEQQFVPVKLNADENSATAISFGVNRVPTDVVITPDGQMVGKLVSPSTPAAYVGELSTIATRFATKSGGAFALASSAAPAPSQLNAAYANLQVAPSTLPALAPMASDPMKPLTPPNLASSATFTPNPMATRPSAPIAPAPTLQPGATMNPYTSLTSAQPSQPTITANGAAVASAPPAAGPLAPVPGNPVPGAPFGNPYIGATSPAGQPMQQAPFAAPSAPPMLPLPTTPIGVAEAPPQFAPVAPPLPAASAMQPAFAPVQQASAAGPAAGPVGVPDPRQLPPGAPPLGFDGYCPVSMRNAWKWTPGNPQFGIVHLGRTYWFAGPEEQKQFWTDPTRYAPALSGMDPVLAVDHKQQVPGKREHSIDYDGLFYMFASEATLQQFTASPQRYAANVRQAMGIPRGRLVK